MLPLRNAALVTFASLSLLVAGCATQKGPDTESAASASTATTASSPAAATPSKAQQELAAGITSYENGQHRNAAKQLQAALDGGLESRPEQAQAHKYLAFIHCVSKRTTQCREEFRKAIASDPEFALTPAEAGHPTWGPVFRKLKAAPPKPATGNKATTSKTK